MRANPQLVENVARAVVEGVAFSRNPQNKKIVLESLAKNLRLDKPDRLETPTGKSTIFRVSRAPAFRE